MTITPHLRTVDLMGFLMCLLTHLRVTGETQVQCHYGHAWRSWRGSGGGAAHDSPVVLLLKVAHTDAPGSTANGKLVSCAQTPTKYVK